MKRKDLQHIVLRNYFKDKKPKKNYDELNDAVSCRTIKRWCKKVFESDTISFSKPSGWRYKIVSSQTDFRDEN